MDVKYDPILDKIRERDTGGGGGGGGDYIAGTGINSVALEGGTVAVANIPQSAVTGLSDALAGKQPTINSGATLDINITGSAATAINAATASALDSSTIASVGQVINGGTQNIVNVPALRGALTAGQAVDVTSQPDNVTGDYKGTFSVTGSLGFASFPKYASGLNYLMIADLTATTSGTVTPSGTWLDGTTTAKSLAAGTSTRVAMLFNAANKAKLTFASTGSVSVTNCREYEVTACSAEAVAYIAALSNPDAFTAYYLVKSDMVQPWTHIIDMGTSPAVTIASGLSYKLNATGTHQLTVDTCPAGYDGRDAIIRIRLGGSGVIQAVAPLQLGGALVPYAINNCVVRFRDGEAVLLVEDTLAGYVVTVNSGTGEGSLPYGLAANGVPYIAFSPSTDGIPVDLSGATTAAEEVTVVGNGYEDTILTGSINCTSKTTVANLALSDVQVMGGTMTFGDAFIPSGSTVAVSGGGLAVERVSGNGGVIDLGKTRIIETDGMVMSGVTVTNGYSNAGGAVNVGNKKADFISCVFSGNSCSGTGGAINIYAAANARFLSCTITGNTSTNGGGLFCDQGFFSSCTISGNTNSDIRFTSSGAVVSAVDCTIGIAYTSRGKLYLAGSNHFNQIAGASATVYIAEGAIIDITGATTATTINPGGGVLFPENGATVYPSAGSASAIFIGDGGANTPGFSIKFNAITNGGHLMLSSGTRLYKDLLGSNAVIESGGFNYYGGNSSILVSGIIFSACENGGYTLTAYQSSCRLKLESVSFVNSVDTHNCYVNYGGTLVIKDCSFDKPVRMNNNASAEIEGNNTIIRLYGGATYAIRISSGASIQLTSSIEGAITVLDGGCVVNGTSLGSAGGSTMYTKITSVGGSASGTLA